MLLECFVWAVQAALLFRAERLVDADAAPGVFEDAEGGVLPVPALGVLGAAFTGWTGELLSAASAVSDFAAGKDG